MTVTDHFAEAERLLALADRDVSVNLEATTGERKADIIAAAQVHATLALVDAERETQRLVRIARLTTGDSRLVPTTTVTIPWPPSDQLVDEVADVLHQASWKEPGGCDADEAFMCAYIDDYLKTARAVLDVIGGEGDE